MTMLQLGCASSGFGTATKVLAANGRGIMHTHTHTWGRGSGGVKSTGVSQSVSKTLQNKRFGAPEFLGISPKLFAALRGIHPYLCTPVLPRGQHTHTLISRASRARRGERGTSGQRRRRKRGKWGKRWEVGMGGEGERRGKKGGKRGKRGKIWGPPDLDVSFRELKKKAPKQKIARTAPKTLLKKSGALPKKTRVLRQIAPESLPESSATSLSHKFFGVPFLSLILPFFVLFGTFPIFLGCS